MKITRPGAARVTGAGRHRAATAMARKAAIERELDRYVRLTCGHYTTRDEIEAYRCWQPRRGSFFCDICDHWQPAARTRRRGLPVPDIPLF